MIRTFNFTIARKPQKFFLMFVWMSQLAITQHTEVFMLQVMSDGRMCAIFLSAGPSAVLGPFPPQIFVLQEFQPLIVLRSSCVNCLFGSPESAKSSTMSILHLSLESFSDCLFYCPFCITFYFCVSIHPEELFVLYCSS